MKLAFLDYVFTWPPLGGAPADLYYTMSGLQRLGHEVHLFFLAPSDNIFFKPVESDTLPFASTRLEYRYETSSPEDIGALFRQAVDAWAPDIVFQCFGFFMKPYVAKALERYPQIARYYAYEPFCPRDYRLYIHDRTCPYNYLRTPNECNRCTIGNMLPNIRTGDPAGYVGEYLATRAHTQAFYDLHAETLAMYKGVIVYNHFAKGLLEGFTDRVHVIGGGVRLDDFHYTPVPERGPGEKKIILMTGRTDDMSKGITKLKEAGEILYAQRNDFEIWFTHPDQLLELEWFKPIGWHRFDVLKEFYQKSDICVVPSLWQEPFGLVAVEAMATGRPVVVSDVGGLQEIVVHDETGYVYHRDDADELAQCLARLLDDAGLRRRMGDAGRKRVEENYAWDKVIETHYPPMLEEAMA